MAKKKQNNPQPLPPIVNRVPGFSSQFKEDLGWWFKQYSKKRYDPQPLAGQSSFGTLARECRPTKGARERVPREAAKILDLVTAVMRDPFKGIGKPEPLKYMDSDVWSRRIDLEHRFIYRVGQHQIDFLACRFHYE